MKVQANFSTTIMFATILMIGSIKLSYGQQKSPEASDTLYMVTMKDGSYLFGKLISSSDSLVVLESSSFGKTNINQAAIKQLKIISKNSFKNGVYWFPNSNATRYYFGPSAINLKQGEGYYQNTYLLLNSCYVGVINNLSIGAGFEFLSVFASDSHSPIYFLTLKGGAKVAKNLHVGAGSFFLSVPQISIFDNNTESPDNMVLNYGLVTFGSDNNNCTLGGAFKYQNKGKGWGQRPILTLSGMTRVSRKLALITENWFVPVTEYSVNYNYSSYPTNGNPYSYRETTNKFYRAYLSYGLRFLGEKISVDLGLLNSGEIAKSIPVGMPYVDFVVKF